MPLPMMVVVVVSVRVVRWANILHFVDGAADGAALDGPRAVHAQPEGVVGVDGVAGTACELLETEGVYGDGVVEGA